MPQTFVALKKRNREKSVSLNIISLRVLSANRFKTQCVFNDEVDSLVNNNHNKKIKYSYHNKSISAAAKGLFQGINPPPKAAAEISPCLCICSRTPQRFGQ